MKNVRVILSVFALVLAVGGTFAAQSQPAGTMTGYAYIEQTPGNFICSQRSVQCHVGSGTPCTIGALTYRNNSDVQSQCGEVLAKD